MENSCRLYLKKQPTRTVSICGDQGIIMADIAKSTRALKLHYPIIPLLINNNILIIVDTTAAPALYIVFVLFV